jgi:hypothetical protein
MAKTYLTADGDLFFGEDGALVEIEGIDAADQLLMEEILMPYNQADDSGNKLISISNGTDTTPIVSKAMVAGEISAVVSRLQRAQEQDAFLTPAEQIDHIEQLIVLVDPAKKTDVNFFLDVRVASQEVIKVRKALTMNQFPNQIPASVATRFGGK